MRRLGYEVMPGIGPREGPVVHGTLAELLAAIPYLLVFELISPRRALDTMFRAGIVDAGMSGGCRWEPFELGEAEYEETGLARRLEEARERRDEAAVLEFASRA